MIIELDKWKCTNCNQSFFKKKSLTRPGTCPCCGKQFLFKADNFSVKKL